MHNHTHKKQLILIKTISAFLCACLLFFASIPHTRADQNCKCRQQSVQDEVNQHSTILVGKILSTKIIDTKEKVLVKNENGETQIKFFDVKKRQIKVKVAQKLKGTGFERKSVITLNTEISTAACGIDLQKGKKYIIYADKEANLTGLEPKNLPESLKPQYTTNTCTRTRIFDAQELADIKKELPNPNPAPTKK